MTGHSRRTRRRGRAAVLGAAAAAVLLPLLAAPLAGAAQAAGSEHVRLEVLGVRPDLVSAGDALVEVVLPAGTSAAGLRVSVDGADVSDRFELRTEGSVAGRTVGLVPGLRVGVNRVRAVLPDGRGAELAVTNHPRGGPIFSGPQVEPWICTTEQAGLGAPTDADCNGATTYRYQYKNAVTRRFLAYDPDSPPPAALVATTTTDEGHTVPYIVRIERGTLNRAIYDIAVLFDPDEPLSPWQPQDGWNRKLVYSFGVGCAPGHSQESPEDPLLDMALSRGFAVAVSTLNVMGNSCNLNVSAETAVMVKERVVEQYGEVRYTIGNGCSGGSEGQNSLAENYPGILDGIRPECTFADGWTPAVLSKSDCALLERYFTQTSPALWPRAEQRGAVLGNPTDSHCAEMRALRSAPQDWDPTTGCGDDDAEWMYDPQTNRAGTRCTLQDYNKASIGTRPDGFANGLLDDVGIQWGLQALLDGDISVEQFVDLNEKVGGWTLDYQPQRARTQADPAGLVNFYRTGQFTYGRNLALTPTIDARTDNTADFHGNIHREVVRARQQRFAPGIAAQAYWTEPVPGAFGLPTPPLAERTFVVMDEWLAAIEADRTDAPRIDKVLRNKPAAAVDACYAGARPIDQSACDVGYSEHSLARLVAGMPKAADVLKCELEPLDRAAYGDVVFTDAQWERLQDGFPSGVCDWDRPGVGQQPPAGDWITLADGPQGRPLGAPPVSRPFGTGAAAQAAAGTGTGTGTGLPAARTGGGLPAAGTTGTLPATGAGALPVVAALLLAATAVVRRRASRRGA